MSALEERGARGLEEARHRFEGEPRLRSQHPDDAETPPRANGANGAAEARRRFGTQEADQ